MGVTIDGCRGAEDQPKHLGFGHRLKQRQRPHHVVLVVAHRLLDRLADRLQAGEMDNAVDRVGIEYAAQPCAIPDIAFDDRRALPGNPLDRIDNPG